MKKEHYDKIQQKNKEIQGKEQLIKDINKRNDENRKLLSKI